MSVAAVERMTAHQISYWYERASAYYEQRNGQQGAVEERRDMRGLP